MSEVVIHPGTFAEFADRYGFTEIDEEYAIAAYREALERRDASLAAVLGITIEAVKATPKEDIAQVLGEIAPGIQLGGETLLTQDS